VDHRFQLRPYDGPEQAENAIETARPASRGDVFAAVGPIGGSARRLYSAWHTTIARSRRAKPGHGHRLARIE